MSKNTRNDPTKARVCITQFYITEAGREVAVDRSITKRLDFTGFLAAVKEEKK